MYVYGVVVAAACLAVLARAVKLSLAMLPRLFASDVNRAPGRQARAVETEGL